jgi:uncharacterized protein
MAERFIVEIDAERVTATAYAADGFARPPVLVLGHGAGAPQSHPFMVDVAAGLAARGVEVVTFDFVYTEKRRRAPDKPALLEGCYSAVVEAVRARSGGRPLLLGGKSMGGRIASQIAPRHPGLAGLVFLGYPLHPPGKPEAQRAKHLGAIDAPMLFVQGSRDAFGTPDELRPILRALKAAELFVVDGGDHSFRVPKKSGASQADVMTRVMDEVARWVRAKGRAP